MAVGLAVRLGSTAEVVTLDTTREALALGGTDDVHQLARLEQRDVELLAHFVVVDGVEAHLTQMAQLAEILEMTGLGFVQLLRIAKTDLDG